MENKEELFIPKTKFKTLKIFIGILLIGTLCAGAYFLYQEKFNNPKRIVENILEESIKNKNNLIIDKNDDKYKINGILKMDVKFNNKEKLTDIINDIDFQFSGEINPKENIGNLEINTKYKDEKLIDIKEYYEKDTVYLLLEEIYDKYLKINSNNKDNDIIPFSINGIKIEQNDINTLITSLKKALKNEVTKLDFKKENVVINIDGKEQNVLNNYAILKNKEYNDFISGIINNLNSDTSFLDILKKLTNQDNPLQNIEEIVKEESSLTYRINFYTDTSLFNKKLISIRSELTQNDITTSFNVDKIQDGLIIGIDSMGANISFKIVRNNPNYNLSYKIDMQDNYIKLDMSVNYEKIKEITKPDISKNKEINKLTNEEKENIVNSFKNSEALNSLIDTIKKAIPQINFNNEIEDSKI